MNNDATVLVVDDTEDVRDLLRAQLGILGFRVVEATNGQEAVEAVRKESPNLILMDVMMPVLDGLAATRLIRKRSGTSEPVIVAFTAFQSLEIQRQALEAGCNDCVSKPLNIGQLSTLLHRLLVSQGP